MCAVGFAVVAILFGLGVYGRFKDSDGSTQYIKLGAFRLDCAHILLAAAALPFACFFRCELGSVQVCRVCMCCARAVAV